jgi:hypothetical protein
MKKVRTLSTRISRQISAAAADPVMSTALPSVGFLDVPSSTPAEFSRRAPCIHARLRRLATKPGEKCGLTRSQGPMEEKGFGLAEFLMSTLVVISLSAGIFTILTDMQGNSGYQAEVLSVMENTRVAMSALGRYIVQAGSNPRSASFTPVAITSSSQVHLSADLTGSSGGSQGDPDGDIADADEDIIIRFNQTDRCIEILDRNGNIKTLANYISAFSLSYFDKDGNVTAVDADVRKIRVTLSGSSTVANPRTRKTFGLTLTSDFTLPNRG